MKRINLSKLVAAGFVSCFLSSVAFATPTSSLTQLYDVSPYAGACDGPAGVTSCDLASGDQADFSSGAQIFYPDYIASFSCTGIPLIQAVHTWTAFISQAATHTFRNVFEGGAMTVSPLLKAALYGIDRSGVTNGGVPLADGTSLTRWQSSDAATLLAVAKVFRGALQTLLSGFDPIATGGQPVCMMAHPGQMFMQNFNHPEYQTTHPSGGSNDWWGPTAYAVAKAIYDPNNTFSLCADPNTPLAQYIKDYIECQ